MSKPGWLEDLGISSGGTCLRTERHPAYRWPEPRRGGRMEHENLGVDGNGEATSGLNHEGEGTDAMLRERLPGSGDEAEECPWSETGRVSTSEPIMSPVAT